MALSERKLVSVRPMWCIGVVGLCAAIPAVFPSHRDQSGVRASPPPAVRENFTPERVDPVLEEVMSFGRESRAALTKIRNYTGVFTKTELVNGRMIRQSMDMKVRHEPFSVYFYYRSGKERGREVVYVAGANHGNLIIREDGFKGWIGALSLAIDSPKVMAENRHTIAEIGMACLLETAFNCWEAEKRAAEPNAEIKFLRDAPQGPIVDLCYRRPQPGIDFQRSRLHFDGQTKLPVRAEQYGWPVGPGEEAPLLEEYHYSEIEPNAGLTDIDFDRENPNYKFGSR